MVVGHGMGSIGVALNGTGACIAMGVLEFRVIDSSGFAYRPDVLQHCKNEY